jgi:dethiobiotin synthetase
MTVVVITGTGTEVGKTVVTAAVAAAAVAAGRSVAVLKAAQTGVAPGDPGDAEEVARLAGSLSAASATRAGATGVRPARRAAVAGANGWGKRATSAVVTRSPASPSRWRPPRPRGGPV